MARALIGLACSARLTGVGLALVATVVAPACTQDPVARPGTSSPGPLSQAAVSEAVTALCTLLVTDDPDEAARAFEDHAHDTIHAIADGVRDIDPALAGAVLEAKDPIETAVARGDPPRSYRDDVRALLDAVGAALHALGAPAAPTCGA